MKVGTRDMNKYARDLRVIKQANRERDRAHVS